MEICGIGKPRRFVTGLREDGTSYCARAEDVEEIDYEATYGGSFPRVSDDHARPEMFRLWAWDELPELPLDGRAAPLEEQPTAEATPDALRRSSVHPKGAGGVRVNLAKFPPGSGSKLHWRDSVDFQWLIAGEIIMKLDDGSEVTLRPGDVVIQNGTNHGWDVRSETGAVLAVVLNGTTRNGASPPQSEHLVVAPPATAEGDTRDEPA